MPRIFGAIFIISVICIPYATSDTIYMKDGTIKKGLIIEEYFDRYVFNQEGKEIMLLKDSVDEIFFDEPFQNNLFLGNHFRDTGDFQNAYVFYQLALQSYPEYSIAVDAIKGLEDAKWRLTHKFHYRHMRKMLKDQLGLEIGKSGMFIYIKSVGLHRQTASKFLPGDKLIRIWQIPLIYADEKDALWYLIGPPNTLVKIVIERDIKLPKVRSRQLSIFFKRRKGFSLSMGFDGLFVKDISSNSQAYISGLRKDDLIVAIDRLSTRYMKLENAKKLIYNANKGVILTVRRGVTVMRMRSKREDLENAMWVWHSTDILLSTESRDKLFKFCKSKNIKTLFFQLPYKFEQSNGETVCRIEYITQIREFLAEAHREGLKVHSLNGSSKFVLSRYHKFPLAQLKALVEFNKKSSVQEKFDGIHFDNELYLLPAYNSAKRGQILKEFLQLNKEIRKYIDLSGERFIFGVDVPFWFAEFDKDGQPLSAVEFEGETKPISFHLLDICDNIGIMDYRNFAEGQDGIIAHALDELRYASMKGKKVFVGVETSRYENEVYFISYLDIDTFNRMLDNKSLSVILDQAYFEGYPLRVHIYNKKVCIGLGTTDSVPDMTTLEKLADLFGYIYQPQLQSEVDSLIFDIEHTLSKNPEFSEIQQKLISPKAKKSYYVFKVKEAMLEKLTFAHLSEKDLNDVLLKAKKAFVEYPAFAGFAIHHYRSYLKLIESTLNNKSSTTHKGTPTISKGQP